MPIVGRINLGGWVCLYSVGGFSLIRVGVGSQKTLPRLGCESVLAMCEGDCCEDTSF